ncbi:cytochrome b [Azomonas macrocytogenes]|uniref:Cytochrome b561 n=1 Tax=Azomonas macrocytogenes TaxID=69962 RepID=A0A839T2V4_AZOMA|nr:cytochrome b [Azomonas macrocytogenes]MBB3103877.1 cytochrome b561 [Azomonas macrocytogenes]
MQWRNSTDSYGLIGRLLHWLVAVTVFGLFGLGIWMRGLDYYSSWYRAAPEIHKSIGMLLFGQMLVRVAWRFFSPGPAPLASHGSLVQVATRLMHELLYLGLFAVMIAGYLISTADGRSIEVFGWFAVPASVTSLANQADLAGMIHKYLAWLLVILAALHALAALKHHFIDRDSTLLRMAGRVSKAQVSIR